MTTILEGQASDAQIAGFAVALRAKGETSAELATLVRTMLRVGDRVDAADGPPLVDTCGTGGDRSGTINVSTAAALVAAGAGVRVAKHGNRAASSDCGSADVLEALGARIDLDAGAVAQCVEEVGFGFMFAPAHHQAMKHVVPVRKDLGVRTIFNFLGPLTNPAGANRQLIGVSDPAYLEVIAGALVQLGATRAAVVSSADGMDEISISGETRLLEVTPDGVTGHIVSPERVGLAPASHESVKGGTPEENAAIARSVLGGEAGPRRSLVALNAGAALFVAARVGSFEEGVRLAEEALDSGAALDAMESFVRKTQELAPKEEAVGRA
jgi:anthranilate phosphoribosyltransferase